jgi:hypothetical protein
MEAADACTYTQAIPDEDIGLVDTIPQLPGCLSVGGVVASSCPKVAFVPATAFVTTPLRQKAGLPIISPGSSTISPTAAPSPTNSQNAVKTSSASPSGITVVVLASNSPPTVHIVVGVVCGIIALVIFSAILWFFCRRNMRARSTPLVGPSRPNENFTGYPIDKDMQRQSGGVYGAFPPAELPSPQSISLNFENHAFELAAVSHTTPNNSSRRGSESDQENVMSWDTYQGRVASSITAVNTAISEVSYTT